MKYRSVIVKAVNLAAYLNNTIQDEKVISFAPYELNDNQVDTYLVLIERIY